MLGDRLVCVWQAVFAQTIAKGWDINFADELKVITKQILTTLSGKEFTEEDFSTIVKHGYTSFQDYKAYIMKKLQDDDIPDYLQIAEIEEECWKISKAFYKSNLPEKALKKLWQIVNRLTLASSYPPIICKEETELVSEKVVDYVKFKGDARFLHDDATFTEMLTHLENKLFKGCSKEVVSECIDDLHCWLVWEVCRTGWLYKHAKTGPNWTNWVKRWAVLIPGRLLFYEKECPTLDDMPKSEFILDESTKVASQSPYKGVDIKLDGRFKLSNQPLSECEIATNNNDESNAWLSEIQQQIQSSDTPVQKLLLERYRMREEHKLKKIDNTNRLSKYLGTSKGGCNFDYEEDNEDEIAVEEEKMKAIYMKLDLDGNGFIDKPEFEKYIESLGLKIKDAEVNLIFNQIDKNSNGCNITVINWLIY